MVETVECVSFSSANLVAHPNLMSGMSEPATIDVHVNVSDKIHVLLYNNNLIISLVGVGGALCTELLFYRFQDPIWLTFGICWYFQFVLAFSRL